MRLYVTLRALKPVDGTAEFCLSLRFVLFPDLASVCSSVSLLNRCTEFEGWSSSSLRSAV